MRWLLLLGLVLVLWSASARAESKVSETTSNRFELAAEAQLAVVKAPFFTRNFPELEAHGFVLELRGYYAWSADWAIGGDAPLSLMNVRQPGGSFLREAAWGNPGVFVRRRIAPLAFRQRMLEGWTSASFGLPLAEHGDAASLLENRALEAANAARSYLSPESFTAGVLPLTLEAGLGTRHGRFAADATLAAPLLLRLSRAELPNEARLHRLGFLPRIGLGGSVDLLRFLRFVLEADAALAVARVFEPREPASRLQLSLRPGLLFMLGRRLDVGLTFVAPIAGPLGGSAYGGALALRLH
jgi:hypothetical protein